MRIAVFTCNFPVLSETFVINQIVGLLKLNIEVDIIANEESVHDVIHSSVKKHTLLSKLSCIGMKANHSKFKKILLTMRNSFMLLCKGELSNLYSILFDNCLNLPQKFNLISALNGDLDRSKRYDNVICHFGDAGYYVCKMRDVGLISGPISIVFHGHEMSNYNTIKANMAGYKKLFVKGELMLPISELWKERLIEWGCDKSKIRVHRMGVDVLDFEMKSPIKSLSIPLKVIQVGRLTEKKAILDSIHAIVMASKKMGIDFTIIGDGELYSEANKLITSLNANRFIHLLGKQSQSFVKKYLDESDVFLLPSVVAKNGDMEGIPVALMEAMAKGLITISTYHSGIPELIEDGVSGFLVGESEPHELAACLLKIELLSADEIEYIRIKARSVCYEKYNNGILNHQLSQYFQ